MILGLIIWGVIVLLVALLAFLGWKKISNIARFEARKNEIGWGMLSIVMVFVSFLFLPLVCLKITDDIGDNMAGAVSSVFDDEIIAAGKEQIRKETNPKKDTSYLSHALDDLLKKTSTKELVTDDLKQSVIDTASSMIYGANITDPLQYSLEIAAKDLMENSGIADLADKYISDDIQNIALSYTKRIASNVVETKIPNPILNIFFSKKAKDLGMNAAGLAAQNTIKKIGNTISQGIMKSVTHKVSELSIKFFFIISIIAALLVSIFLLIIIFMLRLPKEEEFEEYDRDHIFQYNNEPLDKINKVRK